MDIALIGYGKMGQAIEKVALQRGHNIVLKISNSNKDEMTVDNLQKADVAIEFTMPEAAYGNVIRCLQAGVPVVCGTTGWNDELETAKEKTKELDGAFLPASNFSVGVNLFFEVNKLLAKLMNKQPQYDVALSETHHTQKKDAPSGTAITLAEQILNNLDRKNAWVKEAVQGANEVAITAHRIENVPGTHHVKYISAIDDIEIIHTAHNREGFAMGAVLAAEFLHNKKGIFEMKDVLGITDTD